MKMIIDLFLLIFLTLFNILLFKFLIKAFVKFKILDEPDFSRKIHTSNIPLVGGTFFIINIILYFVFKFFIINDASYFEGFREVLSFLIGSILFI